MTDYNIQFYKGPVFKIKRIFSILFLNYDKRSNIKKNDLIENSRTCGLFRIRFRLFSFIFLDSVMNSNMNNIQPDDIFLRVGKFLNILESKI